MAKTIEGQNDDFRALVLDDADESEDVYQMDTSLETLLYGNDTSQEEPLDDVVPLPVNSAY